MKTNPTSGALKLTAICLGAFYLARWYVLYHLDDQYGGLLGGLNALANTDSYSLWLQLSQWLTLAYAITWMVFVWVVAVWVYNGFFATDKAEPPKP